MPDAAYFHKQAETCRKLASTLLDREAAAALRGMAEDYEQQALKLARAAAGTGEPDLHGSPSPRTPEK